MKQRVTKKVYIETYGCQMNKYDSELVAGLLRNYGYETVHNPEQADVILVNTCSVREHAERRALGRLSSLYGYKLRRPEIKIGVLGCMAQSLGEKILEKKPFVDFVIGPDAYRKVLVALGEESTPESEFSVRAFLEESGEETYDDVYPCRVKGISAWVAVMRGCNNHCSYCIVPYVRGAERSRPADSVVEEVRRLADEGFVEVTLLGQNVNSYSDGSHDFADLIRMVSQVEGIQRVRFATSHPKDLSDKLIQTIAENPRICNHIHLPVQSGSSRILKLMNRVYTRERYLERVEKIRKLIPQVSLTTDIIVGFPTETDEDFQQTLSLLEEVQFDGAFIFKFSPRRGTPAAKIPGQLPDEVKQERLQILNDLQKKITLKKNRQLIGQVVEVLVEGPSKKSKRDFMGRTETNKIVVFPKPRTIGPGSLAKVRIVNAEGVTLFGECLEEQK